MTSPYGYMTTTGNIIPDTSDILTTVEGEFKTALGADVVLTADTPQGALCAQEVQTRANVIKNNAIVSNQINPNIAGGVFLDAICAFLGLSREPTTFTVVPSVSLAGAAGAVIPEGSKAYTGAGDMFVSVSSVTLSSGGTGSVNFQALFAGPVPCGVGALTNIESSSAVLGWETITNSTAGIMGVVEQSDVSLQQLRIATLALQGASMIQSISSAVADVPGVTSSVILENYSNVPMGMLIGVTGGTTLSGTIWGLSTTGPVTVGTTGMSFIHSLQSVPGAFVNPWPTAAFTTTGNVTLSGLGTQSGGDWGSSLTAGQIVLCVAQATASQNGLWIAAAGSWARHPYNASGAIFSGSNSGVSMIAHSVWVCVAGGTNAAIATALLEEKSGGCGWNGSVSTSVVEASSGQSYGVLFDRPVSVGIAVIATVGRGSNTSDLAETALQAMIDFTNGNIQGESGWVIGANASPYDLGAAIVAEQPGCKIHNIQIALVSNFTYQNTEIPIAMNQIATLNLSYITINII